MPEQPYDFFSIAKHQFAKKQAEGSDLLTLGGWGREKKARCEGWLAPHQVVHLPPHSFLNVLSIFLLGRNPPSVHGKSCIGNAHI